MRENSAMIDRSVQPENVTDCSLNGSWHATGSRAARQRPPHLKLHLSQNSRRNAFTAYGEGYVAVNGVRYESSLVVLPDRIVEDWSVPTIESLTQGDMEALALLKPELVLLGTGDLLRFPDSRLLASLAAARIGAEFMDTRAACRTYNILAAEGRNVAAALIIPVPAQTPYAG